MEHAELLIPALLVAVAGLSALARVVNVPYPILLVLGGLVLGFVPGAPEVELDPELVLVLFLPPLLYSAAFFSSLRDLRANLRPISTLAIGLVLATMVAVAVVAHTVIDGISWEAAFVLGAIVSPTDPVAATAIARRLGAPRRIVTIVEGESLVNDGTALVAYRAAVVAVVSGSFSLFDAGLEFVVSAVGGVAIGIAVGWLIAQVRRRLDDPPVEITISLFTAYAAYLPAEELGFSGVLAAVTVGIFVGVRTPILTNATVRLQGFGLWEILVFLLNATLFVLVGFQLPMIVDNLEGQSLWTLAGYAAAVSAVVILVRLAWMHWSVLLIRLIDRRQSQRTMRTTWQERTVVGWSGMRGAVSLAAALAIPLTTDAGAPFPERDTIIFITFGVILATLVFQGLTLPLLINALGVEDDGEEEREELLARQAVARAALEEIDRLAEEDWTSDDSIERLRGSYGYRLRRFEARDPDSDGDAAEFEDRSQRYQRTLRQVLEAQRAAVVGLRDRGEISSDVMRIVERELDLEESRLEI